MISHKTKPDFLIIGTQRGGTTSLFSLLSDHPEIFMPEEKEVHYFDLNYDKGIDWYVAKFPAHPRDSKVISGEASPYYLFHPHVPARVAKDLPEVKLIALLRDPVDRAYSNYMLERKRNAEPLDTFSQAVAMENLRTQADEEQMKLDPNFIGNDFQRYSYMKRGLYGQQVQRWFTYFPKDRFLLLKSEEFYADPKKILTRIYDFLDIEDVYPKEFRILNKMTDEPMTFEMKMRWSPYFREDGKLLRSIAGEEFSW